MADGDGWLAAREVEQDRVEHVLGNALALLRAARRRLLVAARREPLAAEFVAGDAGAPDAVLPEVARIGRVAHRVGEAPAAAELHGAHAHHVHLGLNDRAVGLLDQQTADAATAEIAGQREPDRPGPDDQHAGGRRYRHGLEHSVLRSDRTRSTSVHLTLRNLPANNRFSFGPLPACAVAAKIGHSGPLGQSAPHRGASGVMGHPDQVDWVDVFGVTGRHQANRRHGRRTLIATGSAAVRRRRQGAGSGRAAFRTVIPAVSRFTVTLDGSLIKEPWGLRWFCGQRIRCSMRCGNYGPIPK